jgi:hypothetical protein
MAVEFQDLMRKQLVLALVQRAIFCPVTHEVLDVRTCVVVLDADEDPTAVLSPEGYRQLTKLAKAKGVEPLTGANHFDPKTIPAEKPSKEQSK